MISKKNTVKKIKHILSEFLEGTNFQEINNTINVENLWKETVGVLISKNTTIQTFKNGTITIKVSNPVWRNELAIQIKDILKKLQQAEPNLNIIEIKLI